MTSSDGIFGVQQCKGPGVVPYRGAIQVRAWWD
jgi:hypothetical protein